MKTINQHIVALSEASEKYGPDIEPAFSLVLRRIRLYARRRISWLRKVWAEAGKEHQGGLQVEMEGYLQDLDHPNAEFRWYASTPEVRDLEAKIVIVEKNLEELPENRLSSLIRTFQLDQVEVDLLHLCIGQALDPALSSIYAYLHDHSARAYVSENLTARLFGYGYYLPFRPDSSLRKWELLSVNSLNNGDPARVELDAGIRGWLFGHDTWDQALDGLASWQTCLEALPNWPLEQTLGRIQGMLKQTDHPAMRVYIAGAQGSGRRSFAARIADSLGSKLLTIDARRIGEPAWKRLFLQAQRQALLERSALLWYGKPVMEMSWYAYFPTYPIQFVIGEVDEYLPSEPGFVDVRVELPLLTQEIRKKLWLERVPAAATWPVEALEKLTKRRQTTIGQINEVAVNGVDHPEAAARIINAAAHQRLGNLAQHIPSKFHQEDLVLSDLLLESLDQFLYEANERTAFWEMPEIQRLFPRGQGLMALFTGAPGTGKTMAAQVIANELQLDLYRIDLSTIVSKYVGETSKNIERILSRAQKMDVILFFDEADALFGKRTDIKDAHDRFANTDTNFLLQAIEQYPGIAILASNKKANIDSGFIRRLRYVLNFLKPDSRQRLQLWQQLVSELSGKELATDLAEDLKFLAETFEITGAQIKFTILTGLYLARRTQSALNLTYLLQGLDRELQKEGRGLGMSVEDFLNKRKR